MIDLDEFERRLRQPNAASKMAEDDPLAELARLVGGQDDPYKAMFGAERQAQPAARGADAGKELDQPARSLREPVTPIDDSVPTTFAAAAPRGERALERAPEIGGAMDAWPAEEYAGASYGSELAEEEPRSRRPLYLMAAIIVVGMAGIGASFMMKGARSGPDEIATIKALEGPAKVAVEATAASSVPGGEVTVLDRGQQAQRVGLVDTREQPVDLSQVQERAPRVIALDGAKGDPRGASGAAHVPVPAPPSQIHASRAQEAVVGTSVPIEPRKVKTVSVRPDGTLVANPPAPRPAADVPLPARRPIAQVTPGAAPVAPVVKPATPKIAERAATTPKPVPPPSSAAASQVAALAPEATAAALGAAPAKGTYAVQLAAPESEEEARGIQVKMMKKHGNDLSGFHTSIRKAVVGDKTVFRVRVGDLSREQAVALCQKVQSGGTACFVAKN
jgi:hypothetical protein